MVTRFPPHGRYLAAIEGRILVATSDGTWNFEMYQESARIAAPLVRELNASGFWAYMVIVTGTVLYHREVLAKAGDWIRSKHANQLVAAAWVLDPTLEGYSLLKPAYVKAYQGLIPCEVFPTPEEAKSWLASQIALAPAHGTRP